MLALALSLALAAPQRTADLKIAAPGLAVTGMDSALSAPLTDQLAKTFAPVRVITPRDIGALLGLERQKELVGCADQGSCMAELGNALGVQGVLLGDVVQLGNAIQVNARIIDPNDGKPLATAASRVGSQEELFDALTRVGSQLRAQFVAAMGLGVDPAATVSTSRGKRRLFPIPLVGGAVVAAGGVLFLALADSSWNRLTRGSPGSVQLADAPSIAQTGSTLQTVGAVLTIVGAAAIAAGFGLLIFGGSDEPAVSLVSTSHGVAVAF